MYTFASMLELLCPGGEESCLWVGDAVGGEVAVVRTVAPAAGPLLSHTQPNSTKPINLKHLTGNNEIAEPWCSFTSLAVLCLGATPAKLPLGIAVG